MTKKVRIENYNSLSREQYNLFKFGEYNPTVKVQIKYKRMR